MFLCLASIVSRRADFPSALAKPIARSRLQVPGPMWSEPRRQRLSSSVSPTEVVWPDVCYLSTPPARSLTSYGQVKKKGSLVRTPLDLGYYLAGDHSSGRSPCLPAAREQRDRDA